MEISGPRYLVHRKKNKADVQRETDKTLFDSRRVPCEGLSEVGFSDNIFLLELDGIAANSKNTEVIPTSIGRVYTCSSSTTSQGQGEVTGPSGSPCIFFFKNL